MSGIKLSEKYGVNPTIPVCFFCGEEKNEVALLGKITDKQTKEEIEAPMRTVIDYEPCDKCKEQWSKGVAIIEVTKNDLGRRCIAKDVQPTGRFIVLKPEALVNCKAGDRRLMIDTEFSQAFGGVM